MWSLSRERGSLSAARKASRVVHGWADAELELNHREGTDELGEQKQKQMYPASSQQWRNTLRGPVDQLQDRWFLVVRFPLAEADGHPVARQSVHPPAGKPFLLLFLLVVTSATQQQPRRQTVF